MVVWWWMWALGFALAQEPLLLDAGGAGSPVLDGFTRLDPSGADDSRVSWSRPPRHVRWAGEPDPLAGDWLLGGTLHLALEPGTWALHAMLGDVSRNGPPWFPVKPGRPYGLRVGAVDVLAEEVPEGRSFLESSWYALAPFPAFGSGKTEWDRQVAPRHKWSSVQVEVGSDGIDLSAFGAGLQGLVAFPVGRGAETEVVLEVAEEVRRAWFDEHVAPAAATWALPDPGEGPLAVQVTRWTDLPDPASATPNPALRWTACAGERLGSVLWLFPGDGAASWRVEGLPEASVSGYEVHWLDQRVQRSRPRRPRPAFLRPSDGTLRGGQGVPVGLALVARVSEGATAGDRTGALVIERAGEALRVPVTLRIRDLDLAPTPIPVGFFAEVRSAVTLATGNGSGAVYEALDADYAVMREHGFTVLALGKASPWPAPWTDESAAETALFSEAARRWRAAGGEALVWMDPFRELARAYRDPGAEVDDGTLARVAVLAGAAARADATTYLYDEEGGRDVRNPALGSEIAAEVRRLAGGVRLAAAIPNPVDWGQAGAWDLALLGASRPLTTADVERIRTTGATPWAYNLGPGRAAAGIRPWEAGAQGAVQWHWDDTGGDPFDDVHDTPQHAYALLAPGGGAVWPTTLLEAYADGVVDLRYLATLEALVARTEAAPKRRHREAAARGRALLDAIRASAAGSQTGGFYDGSLWSEASLEVLRQAVGDEAERLRAVLEAGARPPRSGRAPAPARSEPISWRTALFEPPPRATLWSPPPPPSLPVGRGGAVRVDGRLDEPGWSLAPLVPPLHPAPEGRAHTRATLQVRVTEAGLGLAIAGLGPDEIPYVLLDPQGVTQRWWILDLGETPRAEACGFDGLELPVERFLAPRAAPCAPVASPEMARTGEGWEILWPWEALGSTTDGFRLGWQVATPQGITGTWSRRPGRRLAPDDAVPLDVGARKGRLVVTSLPFEGVQVATLRVSKGAPSRWAWQVLDRGAVLSEGVVDIEGTEATFHFEDPGRELFTVAVTGADPGRFPPLATRRARGDVSELRVVTPAFTDHLEVAFRLGDEVPALPLQVLAPDGAVVAEGEVGLPAGVGVLRIEAPGHWPDRVSLSFGEGLAPLGSAVRAFPGEAP